MPHLGADHTLAADGQSHGTHTRPGPKAWLLGDKGGGLAWALEGGQAGKPCFPRQHSHQMWKSFLATSEAGL